MRGLAIGRSIADAIAEPKPTSVRKRRGVYAPHGPVYIDGPAHGDGILSLRVQRDQIEVTTFGDPSPVFIPTSHWNIEMELSRFEHHSPYMLDAIVGGNRYRGAVNIEEWECSASVDAMFVWIVTGVCYDLTIEPVLPA